MNQYEALKIPTAQMAFQALCANPNVQGEPRGLAALAVELAQAFVDELESRGWVHKPEPGYPEYDPRKHG